ncbi:MAG: SURF1 family protein [Mobilicoccus sp.]|nr:SURF1 family protein [Mobilicoccus sp.]
MLRTALQPKWLALLGLVVVIIVAFTWLGLWQLNVSQQRAQTELLEQVETAPEVPIDEVLPPHTPITGAHVGRKVYATGVYDAEHQLQITGRRLGDEVGTWVLTPLVVDATGARLAVVRGFVPEGDPLPPAPTGEVTVHGSIQPQEGPPDEPRIMPAGQAQTVDLSSFVNIWPSDIYNAFVFVEREDPAATGASAQFRIVPPPAINPGGVNWRNFAYAVQWWIFAAFVLYVWWRMVRDDHQLRLLERDHDAGGPDPGDGADDAPTRDTVASAATPATADPITSPGGSR